MAMLTNAFNAFGATGNREDLSDLLSDISPKDTPFYDTIGSSPVAGTYTEWQTDALGAANADNAGLEGETFSADAVQPTKRYGNYCVISTKEFTVTETQEVVNKAGRGSEKAYQKIKAMAELKRDMETMLFHVGTAASAGAGSTTVARRMSNVFHWIQAVTAHTGVSGAPGGTGLGVNLTGVTILESQLNDIVQKIWADGGKPNAVYVNGTLKRTISGWGTSTSRVWDGSKKVTNVVDIYEGDFATLEIKKDMFLPSSVGFILEEAKWKKGILIPVGEVPLARRGLGYDTMIRQSWTLKALNPTANGMFISAP